MDSDDIMDELKHELPTYMAIADGTSAVTDKLEWWKNHASELPNGLVVVEPFFCSNPHLLRQSEFFPS